ncbi:hypothetical protein ACP4OV_013039 [Aristida adscensionis]
MEVAPPPAAAVAAALLKCRGDGGGGEPRLEAFGRASRSPSREAAAAGSGEPDATPATARRSGEQEGEEEPLRRGLAAARARARRKAAHATPSPSWKLEPSPPRKEEEAGEPEAVVAAGRRGAPAAAAAASARQLGATLWEIQDVIRVAGAGRRIRRRGRRSTAGDEADQPRSSGGCGGHLAASFMEHGKLHEDRCHSRHPLSPASYTSSVGAASINLVSPTRSLDFRQAGYNLKTSTELLKVLNRIWSLEEQHAADVSALKGLKQELQHAQGCIQELMQERQRYHHEIDSLARQVAEDKLARRNKEQEKIRAALHSLREELEDERHLRKHSETLHRKLGKELSEMKSAFVKAVKDLEKEKKATCLLENLCDEFAKGIRNYEEEVRVLKQKHAKEYEHKFDKSVVHISEAWLDERMQMQNANAREDLPGRTSITERLSSEIQNFLHHAKRSGNSKNGNIHIGEKQDASLCQQSLESVHLNGTTSAPRLAEDDDGSSIASDLHCFELNMDGGAIKSHDLAGTRRRVTSCIHSPMRRLEYSNCVSVEGSPMSNVPPCSKKDKARSSINRANFIASTADISSRSHIGIASMDEQNETVMTQVSRRLHDDLLKIKTEAPQHAYQGQNSHHSRIGQMHKHNTIIGDLHDLRSPVQQLNNQSKLLDRETSESSPQQLIRTKENTLKAKLLQARLEGQHARMRASVYSLISTRRK